MEVNSSNGLEMIKAKVQQKFNEIRAALHMREKLLLRQLEVIASSQQIGRSGNGSASANKLDTDVKFITEKEVELLAAIRCFGRYQLDNMNLALQEEYLKNEDYIAPADDHETMYKCLHRNGSDLNSNEMDMEDEQPEAIVVDFSRNKSLVENNAKLMNKSIINITLQEAKELIKKAKIKRETHVPPLNLEELDDELESSIAEAVSSLGGRESIKSSHTCVEPVKKASKKSRFKPKITINNCNGTINLRNIASLTINCANEEAISAELPIVSEAAQQSNKMAIDSSSSSNTENTTPTTTASNSNYSSNASSRSQSKKQKNSSKKTTQSKGAGKQQEMQQNKAANNNNSDAPTSTTSGRAEDDVMYDNNDDEDDSHVVTCDFYNRLLNEIKKSLKEKPTRHYDNTTHVQTAPADSTCDVNSNVSSSSELMQTQSNTQHDYSYSNASTNSSRIQPGKRLILKNFENLKIILEANSGDEDAFHPVQIEQWLAEIISESDLEPVQSTDILEHSKINSEST